jgi:hypothetical protein
MAFDHFEHRRHAADTVYGEDLAAGSGASSLRPEVPLPDLVKRHRKRGGQPAGGAAPAPAEKKPTRFTGTVMISPERPARDIHQIIEAIVEQLTTLPGAQVKLKLEIEAEVPGGLERAKVRTLVENANTLGFFEKSVE